MMNVVEIFILALVGLGAVLYIFIYLKRTLTRGEDGRVCAGCPLNRPPAVRRK